MAKWEVGHSQITYQDSKWIWMRPVDRIPLTLGAYGWVRLTPAEARDMAQQLLAAAERLELEEDEDPTAQSGYEFLKADGGL